MTNYKEYLYIRNLNYKIFRQQKLNSFSFIFYFRQFVSYKTPAVVSQNIWIAFSLYVFHLEMPWWNHPPCPSEVAPTFSRNNDYWKTKNEVSLTQYNEMSACTISMSFPSLSVLESFYRRFQMPPILFIL